MSDDLEKSNGRVTPAEVSGYGKDPLMDEFRLLRLNMRVYASKLKQELCASDPHYKWVKDDTVDEGIRYILAYETPNWGTRQRARQDLGAHLGVKPSDKMDVDVRQPVIVEIIEQPGCPEVMDE